MKEITIIINLPEKASRKITFEMEDEIYNKILKICEDRKADISDLLINDITEMTPEEAENILFSWDM